MADGGHNMGPSSDTGGWAQIASFIVAALTFVGGIIYWTLDRMLREKISEAKVVMLQKVDTEVSNFGETGSALRQKIIDVEIWSRDTFVRRDEFQNSIDQVNRNIDALRASTESAKKDLDDKLDKLRDTLDKNRESMSEKLDRLLSR